MSTRSHMTDAMTRTASRVCLKNSWTAWPVHVSNRPKQPLAMENLPCTHSASLVAIRGAVATTGTRPSVGNSSRQSAINGFGRLFP
jgi:hypothetical protein